MRRFHVFQFGINLWLPAKLRDALTAYLVPVFPRTPFPALIKVQLIAEMGP